MVRLVNEPTAAALAYGLDKQEKEMKILVYDLGGGTLDVTIMEFGGGVFEVKSTSGDTQLGGTDMDTALTEFIKGEIFKQGLDISGESQATQRVKEAVEKAKIELSTTLSTEINLPFLGMTKENKPFNFTYAMTRAKLEDIVVHIVERTTKPVMQALKDAKLEPKDIDKVILVGGPTRMPIVQRYVEQLLGKKIERGVDPMEAVAFGAAIQAGVFTGEIKDIILLDVTPLSLGIEVEGGITVPLIERNTTIPIKKSNIFSTASDNQPSVPIHVVQGENKMAKYNISLGSFELTGIPPAPRGVPKIEVTFDIDANGILHVTAKDQATGKEQSTKITSPQKMSKEEIEKKVREAEKYAEQDKVEFERAEARNEAEGLVYRTEHTLKEFKDKISKEDLEKAEKAKADLEDALKKDETRTIKERTGMLDEIMKKIGSSMYQGAGQGQNPGPAGNDAPGESPENGGEAPK